MQIEGQRQVPIRIAAVASAVAVETKKEASPAVAAAAVQTLPLTHQFLFTEQLGHLLGSGMTLDEALGILVRRLKQPKLQGLSQSLHQSLVDGRSLSQAMKD